MADADHYNALQAEAAALADEMETIIHDVRPEKTILQGSTGSRRAGNGLEFFEMVDFNPEDHERSQIDARTSARKDEDFVRLPEDEALIQCVLWRATGPHMNFSSGDLHGETDGDGIKPSLKNRLRARMPGALRGLFGGAAKSPESKDTLRASLHTGALRTKQDAADILLMATARLLLSETQANQVMLLNGTGTTYSSRQHVGNLALELYECQEPSQLGSEASDETRHLRRNAKVFLFSDCLRPIDEAALQTDLDAEKDKDKHPAIFARHYTAGIVNDIEHMQAHDVRGHLVHIFDPLEWDFPVGKGGLPDGRVRLSWGGNETEISRARDMRMDYLKRIHAVQKALHSALEAMEWGYSMYVTDQPLIDALTPLIGVINEENGHSFNPDQTLDERLAQDKTNGDHKGSGRQSPKPA